MSDKDKRATYDLYRNGSPITITHKLYCPGYFVGMNANGQVTYSGPCFCSAFDKKPAYDKSQEYKASKPQQYKAPSGAQFCSSHSSRSQPYTTTHSTTYTYSHGRRGNCYFESHTYHIGVPMYTLNLHNCGASGGQPQSQEPKVKGPPIEHDVYVSLEEVDKGCVKKMKINRLAAQPGGSLRQVAKILHIDVKPGWKAGTKVIFPCMSDEIPGKIPADIVFIIRDKKHDIFKRDGSDIKYTAKLTLSQAVYGCNISVPTLQGHRLVQIDTVGGAIKTTTVKRLQGFGLPLSGAPDRRGDLLIDFDIKSH